MTASSTRKRTAAQPADALPAALRADFANPSAQFRGAPFWAWNGELDPETCRRQIDLLHDAGLGGFFMHARVGLRTPYLSDRWFECVDACVDEAKKLKMRAWLYDEDRWPSGAAGSFVTSNPRYRARGLHVFTCPDGLVPESFGAPADAKVTAAFLKARKAVAAFTARVADGKAENVRRVPAGKNPAPAKGESVIFCTIVTDSPDPWYNGATYLDTLNPEATAKFISVTHDAYARNLGKDLGGTVPGIFTDEPNHKGPIGRDPNRPNVHILAWTDKLPAAFRKLAGYDIVARIPELVYDVKGVDARRLRYDFNNCLTELFVKGFVKQIGDWCARHRCNFTGHMLAEDSLVSQTTTVGSCMRCYEYMQAPGIDQLTEPSRIFQTAKQLSSAAHQFGRKWRLSETYGCTGWDFPFAGHKAIGDWQLALGVNLRCQHLSWYTMKAQAKRDYPAAVFYQSPWWEFYGKIEDYFGRVNAVMTHGEEVRDILVIHPVESVWTLVDGGDWQRYSVTKKLEDDFRVLSDRLLAAHLDFDYGDEDILARHGKVARGALAVGRAAYKAVVVPSVRTLRASTLALLARFRKAGGLVIFAGDLPDLVDARPSEAAKAFAASCERPSGSAIESLLSNAARRVSVADAVTGKEFGPAICLLREDADFSYLFICNTGETFFKEKDDNPSFRKAVRFRKEACDDAIVTLAAPCGGAPLELDPETGAVREANASVGDGVCLIRTTLPALASRLFAVPKKGAKASASGAPALPPARKARTIRSKKLEGPFAARLSEANVLVLDQPRYRIGGGDWQPNLEILRLDHKVRDLLGAKRRGGHMYQPWTTPPKANPKSVPVELEYEIDVKALPSGDLFLAIEEPQAFNFAVNGTPITYAVDSGWWTDKSLRKIRLDPSLLRPGANTIRASLDFSENFPGLEIVYLLGTFGTSATAGGRVSLTKAPETLKIGDWCPQGLTFYAGHVGYALTIRPRFEKGQRVVVKVGAYYGVAVRVLVDGRPAGITAWAPGEVDITDFVASGKASELVVEVLGSRRNSHGALHWHEQWPSWHGPNTFEHYDDHPDWWKDGYNLVPAGLMESPALLVRE